MMNVIFVSLFLLMMTEMCSCMVINWIDGYMSEDHPGKVVEYTYFKDKKTWNEAKYWCESIGGSLAKIDSRGVLDVIVHTFWDTYNQDIFEHDYWIGLTEINEGQFQWVSDCSGLTWRDNYLDAWDSSKECFRLKRAGHLGDRDDCDDDNAFLCQRYLNQSCVMATPTTQYFYDSHFAFNESECERMCYNDTHCAAASYTGLHECKLLSINNGTNNTGNWYYFYVKNCVSVDWVQTNVDPPNDNSDQPNLDCTNVVSTSTTSTTSSSSTTSRRSTTSTSTTTLAPPTCSMPVYVNLSYAEIIEIAREISKNLTIDVKKTSAYIRRLTSAEDNRSSSTAVGYVGLIFIVVPLSGLILTDLVSVIFRFRRNIVEIWTTWRLNNMPDILFLQIAEPDDLFGQHWYV